MVENRFVFYNIPYTPRMREALGLDNNEVERRYLISDVDALRTNPHGSDWTNWISPEERIGVPSVDVLREYHEGTLTYFLESDDEASVIGLGSQICLATRLTIPLVKILDLRDIFSISYRL